MKKLNIDNYNVYNEIRKMYSFNVVDGILNTNIRNINMGYRIIKSLINKGLLVFKSDGDYLRDAYKNRNLEWLN